MRELDKVYPEGGKKKRERTPVRIPRRAIAIAITCVVLVIVLIPATSEAVRRRMNELIKKIMPQYTDYQLDEEVLGFDGKTYVPTYIPEGFKRVESKSEHILMYRSENGEWFDIEVLDSAAVVQLNTENATVEPIFIGEESGEIVISEGWTGVIWSTEENIITVTGPLAKEEILKIARSIKTK